MLDTLNSTQMVPLYGYLLLIGLAYLNGYLMREFGLVKVIAFVFLSTTATEFLIAQDDLLLTIPYLVIALIAYYGITPQNISGNSANRSIKDFINRIKEAIGQ